MSDKEGDYNEMESWLTDAKVSTTMWGVCYVAGWLCYVVGWLPLDTCNSM